MTSTSTLNSLLYQIVPLLLSRDGKLQIWTRIRRICRDLDVWYCCHLIMHIDGFSLNNVRENVFLTKILIHCYIMNTKKLELQWKCTSLFSYTGFKMLRACIVHMVGFDFSTWVIDTKSGYGPDRWYHQSFFWVNHLFCCLVSLLQLSKVCYFTNRQKLILWAEIWGNW